MSESDNSENAFMRPLLVGSVAALLDHYYIDEPSLTRNAMFGASVAAGVYAAELVTPLLMPNLPSLNENLYNGKTMATRGTEVSLSAVSGYSLNKYVLNNDKFNDEFYKRLAVIAVSDVVGTYLTEYLSGQPLSFIQQSA